MHVGATILFDDNRRAVLNCGFDEALNQIVQVRFLDVPYYWGFILIRVPCLDQSHVSRCVRVHVP